MQQTFGAAGRTVKKKLGNIASNIERIGAFLSNELSSVVILSLDTPFLASHTRSLRDASDARFPFIEHFVLQFVRLRAGNWEVANLKG